MTVKRTSLFLAGLVCLAAMAMTAGCASEPKVAAEPSREAGPDYSRPLPPGRSALTLLMYPTQYPDLAGAYRNRDVFLLDGIDRSLKWFDAPSSKQHFPMDGITHEQAKASLVAFGELLTSAKDEADFINQFIAMFDVYKSVGYDGSGTVLFTGYFSPEFRASENETSQYRAPLYRRPEDLASDPKTGEPLGRKLPNGGFAPYFTRREIETTKMFEGNELVWLETPLDAYIVQVNGSAKLRMPDGTVKYIGYGGKTGRAYTGLGSLMIEDGILAREGLSLQAIRNAYKKDPARIEELILHNDSYVFFQEYGGDNWPSGSLGVQVTQETSLATDKKVYPRGGLVLVDTESVNFTKGRKPFLRFMLDQDTGGAIQAPGRADIFMGIGLSAEILAGGQYAEGELYYIFLKPKMVKQYLHGTAVGPAN